MDLWRGIVLEIGKLRGRINLAKHRANKNEASPGSGDWGGWIQPYWQGPILRQARIFVLFLFGLGSWWIRKFSKPDWEVVMWVVEK